MAQFPELYNPCRISDLPAFISYPHLLDASPEYQSLVDGLHPDPKLHGTFMDLEPTTGVPLRGFRRFQINVLTKPNSAIHIMKNISKSLVPILWLEEGAEVGDSQLSMIRDQLLKILHIADIIKWVLIGCGLCMAVIGITMSIWKVRQRHYHPD